LPGDFFCRDGIVLLPFSFVIPAQHLKLLTSSSEILFLWMWMLGAAFARITGSNGLAQACQCMRSNHFAQTHPVDSSPLHYSSPPFLFVISISVCCATVLKRRLRILGWTLTELGFCLWPLLCMCGVSKQSIVGKGLTTRADLLRLQCSIADDRPPEVQKRLSNNHHAL
jgi:hypothetical protein